MKSLTRVTLNSDLRRLAQAAALAACWWCQPDMARAEGPAPGTPSAVSINVSSSVLSSQIASVTATNGINGATFEVRRYELAGNSALPQEVIDHSFTNAIGPRVSLAQIRHALGELQLAYRERGLATAEVALPRQTVTNGTVAVMVKEGKPVATGQVDRPGSGTGSTNLTSTDSSALPYCGVGTTAAESLTGATFDVRRYEVSGNSVLPAEIVNQIFAEAIGPKITLAQIRHALGELELAYRERGFATVEVAMPRQELTNGTVRVKVTEWQLATLESGSKPPAGTALAGATNAVSKAASAQAASTGTTNRAPVPTFEVRHYEVTGNSVLAQEVVDGCFASALGPKVSMDHIRHALGELQLAYRERGFATVAVGLPPQQLTNATIKVKVTEGKLADIRVAGNRFFSSNNVMRALPSLHTNTLLNSRVLQRELDVANVNRDRQIYPTVGPGPEPGTSALTLKVKDRLPVHGRAEVDNYATPGTPDMRMNFAAQYNNLWQREQQVGLSYGFTPDDFKPEGAVTDQFFNRPLISYYGAYYRVPFGSTGSVEESINNSVGQFGYNEATHEFRLPPAGARPDLTLYASGSSSSTGIKYSPTKVVASTPLLTILSQDSGQDVTLSEDFGGRLSVPLTLSDQAHFSFSAGADYKNYKQESYNTNSFTITTVVTNAQGSQTIRSKIDAPQAARISQVNYVPLTLGTDFSENDKSGSTSASVSGSFNFSGNSADFAALSTSPKASATYGKLNLSLSREQKVYREWSLLLRGSGQAATGPLISNEQFALGGINSVRGYFEGDEYGDSGWFASAEARTPLFGTRVASFTDSVPTWVRASVFVDYGQCYLLETASQTKQPNSLWGAGFGLSANVNNHLDVRLAVGWPLLSSANTQAGVPRAYITISGQF